MFCIHLQNHAADMARRINIRNENMLTAQHNKGGHPKTQSRTFKSKIRENEKEEDEGCCCSVICVCACRLGAYRTYVQSDVKMSEQDLMVIENVLALTEFNNPVENGTVEIYSSVTVCHKLATDKSNTQKATINVDGKDQEVIYYWHYDNIKKAANCRTIKIKEYNDQELCKGNTLRSCKQYGGSAQPIKSELLGYY